MNGQVIFMERRKKVHQSLGYKNLATNYEFPEVSCVIPKKAAYMDD